MLSFDVSFELDARELDVEFNRDSRELMVEFENLHEITVNGAAEHYTGAYDVTPKIMAQSLPTAGKQMRSDVTVKAIPYYEVGNAQRGETVIIGG